jgi:hypothetical protein
MRTSSRAFLALTCTLTCTLMACNDPSAISGTTTASAPRAPNAAVGGVELAVTGSGHVLRDLGAGAELTTFSYNAIRRADDATTGQFQFNFRALNLVVHGTVTCVTSAGNVAWIGGVIDRLHSDDAADQALVGTDIWWRVTDRGEGSDDSADLTTSLLFTIAGNPTTAASWCADRPTRGVERPILSGNIQVR